MHFANSINIGLIPMKQKQASASLVRDTDVGPGCGREKAGRQQRGGEGTNNRNRTASPSSPTGRGSSRAAVGRRARPARAWRPQYLGGTESVTRLASSTPVLLTGLPCLSSLLVASMSQIMTKSLRRSAARHVAKHTTWSGTRVPRRAQHAAHAAYSAEQHSAEQHPACPCAQVAGPAPVGLLRLPGQAFARRRGTVLV